MGHKRTKKDVREAYRRGFEDGFTVRPNPLSIVLRSLWKKREQKKLKKAYIKKVMELGKIDPVSIGQITSIEEGPDGISIKGKLNE